MTVHIDDWGVRRLDASNEAIDWAGLDKVEFVMGPGLAIVRTAPGLIPRRFV